MMIKNGHIMKLPPRLMSSEFKKKQKKQQLYIFRLNLANVNSGPGSICKKIEKKKEDRLQQ